MKLELFRVLAAIFRVARALASCFGLPVYEQLLAAINDTIFFLSI
ncbi:hypothetical protein [Pectobacterium zantedeschiae]|nr:hypothetical protein [Pectobacterium zantedeschiae]